ncbi:DUF2194 domain-containing protein [Brevibacillus panacihumi]|uniref:DUF2194 domain-containing protein n=1 Tax=Brevibacillus panacihumi TaxID=497735 RepID=UPI003D04FF06
MQKEVGFRRNVYLIMLMILGLAVLIQVSRSQLVLQFKHNDEHLKERAAIMARAASPDSQAAGVMTDELYCLAYLGDDAPSVELKDNTARTLSYLKRQIQEVDLNTDVIDYDACTAVLLATGELDALESGAGLEEFVHRGGAALLMTTPVIGDRFHQMYRKLGIIEFEQPVLSKGVRLLANVLIAEKGLEVGEEIVSNVSNPVELDAESTKLIESEDGIPLMWKRQYGAGNLIVYNGDKLHLKNSRGLIVGAVSMMQPDFLYPIFNSKIFFIDDFPSPIAKRIHLSIYRQYGMDLPTFFQDVWWPDMLKASRLYNVKYTAAVIQSYNDEVNPPFRDPIDQEWHQLVSYGREVIKSGGEIAVHGYNHQSLQTNKAIADYLGYRIWNSQEDMEESIKEVNRYLNTAFPNFTPMTYVPPSNVLGREDGREALKNAWPQMSVIASLYDTDYEGRAYVQEFELSKDGIIEMPRVTSGYFETPYTRWLEANTITSVGVFSHFLHPDDLLDHARGRDQTWEKLYQDFSDYLERLHRTYPWMRDITSTEAGFDMVNVLQTKVSVTKEPQRIKGVVDQYKQPLYYVLRTERKIAVQENCTVQKIDENVYLVTVTGSTFSIGLGG